MQRTDWIENRILWRLRQHGDVADLAVLTDSIPQHHIAEIETGFPALPLGRPVFAFAEPETWTVLTTELIASHHAGRMQAMNVHNGFSIRDPFVDLSHERIPKRELQYLTLVAPDLQTATVWAPKGSPCFALWSILLMFPFNRSAS